MQKAGIIDMFKKRDAFLSGHFRLTSGLHSGHYLQCALVLQYPEDAAKLGRAIADKFRKDKIDVVAGPALGGIIIAYEVARSLGVRCVFGEREEGRMKLRRGFSIKPGEKVLLAEDVATTGGSLKELARLIRESGGEIVGMASIIDRSGGTTDFGVPFKTLMMLNIETFEEKDCPLCKECIPIMKPGSRK
ncbi:MAG: orotate phosphoribosyltransferase [Candidatus Omnitrophica bacterium]|nr:orotate phosphoribosyltransferase [Candidatus Omnitrophota bacterium]MBU4488405.1 orotate phosphoribosyltransferase [Candidatus Omnitrophota bacterium]MCG2705001.1 orotate phosphoribosyltransferase [Candidatus Omnitrophota bacterium]